MEVTVTNICRELEKTTLRGSRDDWGEESERIFQTLELIKSRFGEKIVALDIEPKAS